MNLTQAISEVKARGFDYLSDARVTTMLNNAKNQLEDAFDWPWLETTATAGTAPLTISDLRSVLYVLDTTNDNPLTGIDARDVIDLAGDLTTTGTASYWWLDGAQTVNVYPVGASAQISVRYRKYSSELSGSDTPGIPARYHPVWIDLAVAEAYKDDDRFNESAALLQDVNRRIEQMIGVYALRNRQNPEYQVITYASEDW